MRKMSMVTVAFLVAFGTAHAHRPLEPPLDPPENVMDMASVAVARGQLSFALGADSNVFQEDEDDT